VRRSCSLIAAQSAISSMVRPQPIQVPVSASSRQILTHGLSKEVVALLRVPDSNVGAAVLAGNCVETGGAARSAECAGFSGVGKSGAGPPHQRSHGRSRRCFGDPSCAENDAKTGRRTASAKLAWPACAVAESGWRHGSREDPVLPPRPWYRLGRAPRRAGTRLRHCRAKA
jgi:hypothetical protein